MKADTSSLRRAPTDREARLIAEHPSQAFGFLIQTRGKPASSLPQGMAVLDKPIQVEGGWATNVVGTTAELSDLCNRMMEDGNPVRGHLLLCDGNGQIPGVGEEGPSEFFLPKPDRECSYC